ncbi:MAG: 4Fe-4S dicluster domain-containing protein [Thermodesulfobacteriota bacterium]
MEQSNMQASSGKVTAPSGELASIINGCYQCGKCSAGCPVASEMDLLPHQMVRLGVLGDMQRIVNSQSIWLCLTCHTCGARCPNGIDVPALLDHIRHQVVAGKIETQQPQVPAFHTTFMQNVRRFGRVHELSLVGTYKMKTKTWFADMKLGLEMFRKGKMHILPKFPFGNSAVKEIFKKSSLK